MATTIDPVTPGYYRSDLRKLTLSEFKRMAPGGSVTAFLFYLLRGTLKPGSPEGPYIPTYWNDVSTTAEMLSDRSLERITPKIFELERLGFSVVSYQRLFKHLFPLQIDNGGASLLHPSGAYMATVLYTINRQPPPMNGEHFTLAVYISTTCPSGKAVAVGNTKMYMDPPPPREVIHLPGVSVTALWERVQLERKRLDGLGEQTLNVTNVEELEKLYNAREELTWHHQVNVRKVMVRLTDAEVEAGQRRFLEI